MLIGLTVLTGSPYTMYPLMIVCGVVEFFGYVEDPCKEIGDSQELCMCAALHPRGRSAVNRISY